MARQGKAPASTTDQHAVEKSGDNSGTRPGTFKEGVDPRRGKGPKKRAPNAGRPPDEFKQLMRGIVSRKSVLERLKKLTSGSTKVNDDVFLKAFKEVTDRGYGKAVQPLEHSGPDGEPIPIDTADGARERIARELAGIATRKRAGTDP